MAGSRPYFYKNDEANKKRIDETLVAIAVEKEIRGGFQVPSIRPYWAMFEREFNGRQLVEIHIAKPDKTLEKAEIAVACFARKDDGTWFQCDPVLKPEEIMKNKPKKLDKNDVNNLAEQLGRLNFQEINLLKYPGLKISDSYPQDFGMVDAMAKGNQQFKAQDSKQASPDETKQAAAQNKEQALMSERHAIYESCTDYFEKHPNDQDIQKFYQRLSDCRSVNFSDYKKNVLDPCIEDYKIRNGKKDGFLGLHGNKIKMTDKAFDELAKKDTFAGLLKKISQHVEKGLALEKSMSPEFRG